MNKESCDCRRVAGPDEFHATEGDEFVAPGRGGDFYYLPYDPENPNMEPSFIPSCDARTAPMAARFQLSAAPTCRTKHGVGTVTSTSQPSRRRSGGSQGMIASGTASPTERSTQLLPVKLGWRMIPNAIRALHHAGIFLAAGRPVIAPPEIRKARLEICEACRHYLAANRAVRDLPCRADLKAAISSESCPISKWKSLTPADQ